MKILPCKPTIPAPCSFPLFIAAMLLCSVFSCKQPSDSKAGVQTRAVQQLHIPEWLSGTWNNSFESNSNNFVNWTFNSDGIFTSQGFNSDKLSLADKYPGYQTTVEKQEVLYRIIFSKTGESIIYEFKLQQLDCSDKPVMTYSVVINGTVERAHYTSCNLVFTQ